MTETAAPVAVLLDITTEAPDAIQTFTELLGFDPVVIQNEGGLDAYPSQTYDWSGFTLTDLDSRNELITDTVPANNFG